MRATWNCPKCSASGERDVDLKRLALAWIEICAEHRRVSPVCKRTDQIRLFVAPIPKPVKEPEEARP